MSTEFKLKWDEAGKKLYETGVDRGVVYPLAAGKYPKGYAWDGLIGVNESPSGAEPTALYANNKKYQDLMSAEEFGGTINAYTYPDEFAECDGSKELAPGVYISQQSRKAFGMTYRTLIGNDELGTDYGYKIHLVYGAKASPSEREHNTVNDSPEAAELSWEFSTTPVDVPGAKPTSHIVIDSTKIDAEKLAALEAMLYGSGDTEAQLPLPEDLIALIGGAAG